MNKRDFKVIGIGFFLGGFSLYLLSLSFPIFPSNLKDTTKAIRESTFNKSGYSLIDPLLIVENSKNQIPENLLPLEKSVRSFLDKSISSGGAVAVSVVFRGYNGIGSFIINPDEKYYPSSLLKVPTMIVYYKLAEKDPSILEKRLYYSGQTDANTQKHIKSPIQLEKESSYTTEELIEHMVKYSDNNAAELLIDNLNNTNNYNAFHNLFNDLGIHQISSQDDYLTVNDYSYFFRVLYNATYLSREMSQKAMKLLTETDFAQGINSGVPNKISVAQKFGEFIVEDQTGNILKREFHNCGIIYNLKSPYLLCVMTKGKSFDSLEAIIEGVSRTVYQFMEKK